jgi:TolC family type I secretion outer membrane protein
MEDFLTEAYKSNPEINVARAQLKAVDESLPQAYAGFLPDLSYNLNNSYTKSKFQSSSISKDFYTNSNSLEVRQSLFGGGESYYAVKASLNKIDAAQNQLKEAEQKFFQEAITAYINAIFSSKIYNLSLKNEEILKKQVESTRQRYVAGDATKTDVAQSESRYASSRSATIQSFNDLTATKSNFRRVFGYEIPDNLQMPTQLPKMPENMNAAMQTAFKNNPQLNRVFSEKKQRDNEVEQVKSQLFPQVDLVGSKSERQSVSGLSLLSTDQDSVALNVTIPIYDGGTTYSRVREFQDRRREANFAYEGQKNTLRDNIVRAWRSI